MAMFHVLAPEVPGGLGENAEVERGPDGRPEVRRLHFEFGWGYRGDDLLECYPIFLVTEALAGTLRSSSLTGFELSSDLEVTTEDQVAELDPDWRQPVVEWLRVWGVAGHDDFGLTDDRRLVVSDRALSVLRQHAIEQCDVGPFHPT